MHAPNVCPHVYTQANCHIRHSTTRARRSADRCLSISENERNFERASSITRRSPVLQQSSHTGTYTHTNAREKHPFYKAVSRLHVHQGAWHAALCLVHKEETEGEVSMNADALVEMTEAWSLLLEYLSHPRPIQRIGSSRDESPRPENNRDCLE